MMDAKSFIAGALAGLAGAGVSAALLVSNQPKYQAVTGGDGIAFYVLDTRTGEVWMRSRNPVAVEMGTHHQPRWERRGQ